MSHQIVDAQRSIQKAAALIDHRESQVSQKRCNSSCKCNILSLSLGVYNIAPACLPENRKQTVDDLITYGILQNSKVN